jgi:hypothetical protein
MTKKEFARLKTEPLNMLRVKERFALPRIVDIQHPLDQKLVLIQILIMCAVYVVVVEFWLALLRSGQFFLQCPILLQWKHTSQGHGSRRAKPIRKGG